MKKLTFVRIAAALLLGAASLTASAAARVFVASYGLDANPCTLVAPCRTLQRGADVADAGGEVVVLDSAGYGPLTITKSLSVITPEGIYAGITLTGAFGALVNPGEGGRVVLRGLSIVGAGGLYGIWVSSGRELRIERCEVSGMVQDGININGGSAVHIAGSLLRANGASGIHVSSGSADVYVTDTRVAENGFMGIRTVTTGLLVIDRSQVDGNSNNGVFAQPDIGRTANVVVRDSRIAGNGGGFGLAPTLATSAAHGILERSSVVANSGNGAGINTNNGAGTGSLMVDKSVLSDNTSFGVFASGANATVHVRESTVMRSGLAGLFQQVNGVVNTCNNNLVVLNGTGPGNATSVPCNQ